MLRLEPGNAIVYGVHAGYRSGTVLTMQASLSLSVPEATYVEDDLGLLVMWLSSDGQLSGGATTAERLGKAGVQKAIRES